MRKLALIAVLALFPLIGVTQGGSEAWAAPFGGQIILTQKPLPAKTDRLVRWLRKNGTRKLKAEQGGGTWKFNFYAALRRLPPQNVVYIVWYQRIGGRFKYINADDLKISGKTIIGTHKLHKILGYAPGKQYQMRITLKSASGNEIVYARSGIITLVK